MCVGTGTLMWFKKSYGSTNETSSCVVEPKVWRANSSDSTLFSSLFVFAGELDLDESLEKHFDTVCVLNSVLHFGNISWHFQVQHGEGYPHLSEVSQFFS